MARHEFERRKREFLQSEWQHMINFCRDKLTYGLNEQTDVRDLRLRVPFSCLIVGKSQCGKTELLLTILRQWRYVTTDHDGVYTKRLYWYYGTASDAQKNEVKSIFDMYRRELNDGDSPDVELHFVHVTDFDDPEVTRLLDRMERSIVVFDDLMSEMTKNDKVASVFTREVHHRRLCVFHLWQNVFPCKSATPTITKHTQYKIVFENAETALELKTMLWHMYPYNHKAIFKRVTEFFKSSPPGTYPFVMFRTSPQEKNRDCAIVGNAISRNTDDIRHYIF